jgi:hypothetical protein
MPTIAALQHGCAVFLPLAKYAGDMDVVVVSGSAKAKMAKSQAGGSSIVAKT